MYICIDVVSTSEKYLMNLREIGKGYVGKKKKKEKIM